MLTVPGMLILLAVIARWMLAHTISTCITPYLRAGGTGLTPDLVLFLYGLASLGGIGLIALFLDRHPTPRWREDRHQPFNADEV